MCKSGLKYKRLTVQFSQKVEKNRVHIAQARRASVPDISRARAVNRMTEPVVVIISCARSGGLMSQMVWSYLNKANFDTNKSTGGACLLIKVFLNADAVRRFTENNQADFKSVKAVCPLVVGFR